MIQKDNNIGKKFYLDAQGRRKKCGIYSPSVDRFILIDSNDFWMALKTAEVLSSKLPTIVFFMPPMNFEINNSNCLEHTIENKTEIKIGPSNIVYARQNPQLKFLFDDAKIINVGLPEDFKSDEKQQMLSKLTSFAQYVQKRVYALLLTNELFNAYNTKRFAEQYLAPEWKTPFKIKADRSITKNGVIEELIRALYLANDIPDAEIRMTKIWKTHHSDQEYLMAGYYRLLGEPVPAVLAHLTEFVPDKLQQHCV